MEPKIVPERQPHPGRPKNLSKSLHGHLGTEKVTKMEPKASQMGTQGGVDQVTFSMFLELWAPGGTQMVPRPSPRAPRTSQTTIFDDFGLPKPQFFVILDPPNLNSYSFDDPQREEKKAVIPPYFLTISDEISGGRVEK